MNRNLGPQLRRLSVLAVAATISFRGNLFAPRVDRCPLPVGVGAGYFIIFAGTGKLAGATGSGTFHELQPNLVRPGLSVPITDSFTGTMTLQG